jgi:hypothetical protein
MGYNRTLQKDHMFRLEEEARERIIAEFLEKELKAMEDLHIPEDQLTVVRLMLHMQNLKLERLKPVSIQEILDRR